jgi:D-3-phosphoglycerate dehydrogenase
VLTGIIKQKGSVKVMASPPTVLITQEWFREKPGPHVDVLKAAGFAVSYPRNPLLARGNLSDQETVSELSGAQAVLASSVRFSDAVLSQLPALRVIARTGVGYDRIDLASASRNRIAVTITPAANHAAVAEHTLALILAVTKRIVSTDQRMRAGEWPTEANLPLRGSTLGIFGLGRTGRSVAIRANAFELTTISTEKYPDMSFVSKNDVELVNLDALLKRSDILTIHSPLTDETRGLFNHSVLARMKKGSILINTARGPLIDQNHLFEALQSGHLAGAGLDVFEPEPTSQENPLLGLDNVVVSSHRAGIDTLSVKDSGIAAAQTIVDLRHGIWPDGMVVNNDLRENWLW